MTRQPSSQPRSTEAAAKEQLPRSANPQHAPRPHLDASPPQPAAPERSEVEQQQDQQPVEPGPLINPPHGMTEQQKERRNG